MKIYSVFDPEFKPFGQVVTGMDDTAAEILSVLKDAPQGSGVDYVPEYEPLQELPAMVEISEHCYGGMPVQLGWCNGFNTKLNCLEYHRDSEFNLGTEDFILLLAHQDDYTIHKETLHSEITRVAHALEALGITHSDTRTNFALFTLPPHREAKLLKDYLAETHQLLIRDASNFETLNSRHFRIAAQSAEANDLLIKGIREWIYS